MIRRVDTVELLFNAAQAALYVGIATLCYTALAERAGASQDFDTLTGLTALVITSLVAHAINTGLVAGASALQLHVPPARVWRRAFFDDVPIHAALTALAVVAAHLALTFPLALPVLLLPAAMLHRALRENTRLRTDTHKALTSLADIVELRDPYTAGHSRRVSASARELALWLGLTTEEADAIACAGYVHDLGKVALDPMVLTKPGRLSEAEMAEMRLHPEYGAAVVEQFAAYGEGFRLVRHHHEAWDGSGYPDALVSEAIPFGARILAVADTFDALTSDRPYRSGMSPERALAVLTEGAGRQWDPGVVAALVASIVANTEAARGAREPLPDARVLPALS